MARQRGAKTAFMKALELESVWSAFNHIDQKQLCLRRVRVKQTNAVAFETEDGKLSWLYFDDKHADYVMQDSGSFQVYDDGTLVLSYKRILTNKEYINAYYIIN